MILHFKTKKIKNIEVDKIYCLFTLLAFWKWNQAMVGSDEIEEVKEHVDFGWTEYVLRHRYRNLMGNKIKVESLYNKKTCAESNVGQDLTLQILQTADSPMQ